MHDWNQLNAAVIAEFRDNDGEVSRFGGLPIIIVHTIGARSGQVREIPLIPVFEDGEMMIYGTAAGSPHHPGWVHNLRANPEVDVEYGTERFTARFDELPLTEARAVVEARAAHTPLLVEYLEAAAPRAIPVFRVVRS